MSNNMFDVVVSFNLLKTFSANEKGIEDVDL